MHYGKLACGVIGFLAAGIGGCLIGLFVGHAFDRGLGLQFGTENAKNLEEIKRSFFENTFLLLGYIAKSDGRVSAAEIEHTEQIFVRLGLNAEQRQAAIKLFQKGAAQGFDPMVSVTEFRNLTQRAVKVTQTLMTMLCALALSDDHLDSGEREALRYVGELLGLSRANVDILLRMVEAQARMEGERASSSHYSKDISILDDAYAALGVSSSATSGEVKKAYRKLMSQNHPDKLIAKGVPEHMIKLATEKTQSIQTAYETVTRSRKQSG